MLQWLCHDRGLCAIIGFPLWSGSLVALALIVVAIVTSCSRHHCSQAVAGTALLFAASLLQSLQPPAPGSAAPATAPLLANVTAKGDFPIFSKLNQRAVGSATFAELRTKLPRSLALEVANRHDAVLAQHGYRLCGANGREIKPQHLGALYDSMRRMCRRKFAAPAKPDGILHCQDDIEAFHPKVFDRCGGEHGGFL